MLGFMLLWWLLFQGFLSSLLGLGLFFFVFSLAYQLFEDPLFLSFIEDSLRGGGERMDLNQLFTGLVYVAVVYCLRSLGYGQAWLWADSIQGIELFKSRKS